MTRKEKKEQIIKIFQETKYINDWFDYEDYIDIAIDSQSIRIFDKNIDELFFNYLIVYNSKAMEFLTEEDPSLTEAFKYAKELEYTLDELDSEKLANFVLEARIREEWDNIKGDIEEILKEDCNDCDSDE
jgi:hypothetical protein